VPRPVIQIKSPAQWRALETRNLIGQTQTQTREASDTTVAERAVRRLAGDIHVPNEREDGIANNNIPNIPPALQTCASTNFFYTASTPAAIQSALVTMFQQAVSTAHITH
jgi:hypothetical protein